MDALDTLVPRSKITALAKSKSNRQGWLQTLWHFGLYGLAAATFTVSPILSYLSMAFVASFFFHGLHETVHQTVFASRHLNVFWSHVFGFLCVRPAQHYKHYHWQHHKYTGNPALDSELQADSFLDFPITSPWAYFFYLSGIPFWVYATYNTLFRHAMGSCPEIYLQQQSDKAQHQVIREARFYLAGFAGLLVAALASPGFGIALRRFWLWPTLLGQPFLRFYLIAEHRGRRNGPLIYENTRTMTSTSWWYRKLAWNMPFHTEHHAWPSVPFYQLPAAHMFLVHGAAAAAAAAAAATTGAAVDTTISDKKDSNNNNKNTLLTRGELESDLIGKGYIQFNWIFLKKLFRNKQIE